MRRPWHIWIAFAACLAVVLAAMGWISVTAVRLDWAEAQARRQEAEARRQAAWKEAARLALWRMDSLLNPLVAQESARTYFVFRPFLPVERAYPQMFNDRGGGEMLRPSPLLTLSDEANVLVHFQFEPDGRITSPQAPTGDDLLLAVPHHVTREAVDRARQRLDHVAAIVDRRRLLELLPEKEPEPATPLLWNFRNEQQRKAQLQARLSNVEQLGRDKAEFFERNQAFQQQANSMLLNRSQAARNNFALPSTDTGGVLMTPLWRQGELLLARRVSAGGREYVQGCLLDWPAIKARLLEAVVDLLPEADLQPVTRPPADEKSQMLAALPARLIPGLPPADLVPGPAVPAGEDRLLSPTGLSLAVAWGCVLLAAAAVAALLLGAVRLSERRATFVSAVTHELRTPLTTFQMYAEMLSEGMVADPQQRKAYLGTLRAEAVRLTHMVENVLAYARLERGRTDGRIQEVPLGRLLDPLVDRLAGRAAHAGMELVVEQEGRAGGAAVRANPAAAEQILFNLVDNACKYAAGARDKRIHLTARLNGGEAELRVRDHGPGLAGPVRRKLFQPFSKSAQEAAHTAPGVGLGLALSRRLARDMGGELRLDEQVRDGACFVFRLAPGGRSEEDGRAGAQAP